MTKLVRWISIIAFISITGCAVKMPVIEKYVLTVSAGEVGETVAPVTHKTLLISAMIADPGYTTNQMIYVTSPAHLRQYARHEWVAPPAQMLLPILAQRVEATRHFRAVVLTPFAGASDYRLDTRLVILQQEFLQPVSQVRCVVRAVLVNTKTSHAIAVHSFQAIVSAPGNNPESGVTAANQAARQIADQVAQFVISHQ